MLKNGRNSKEIVGIELISVNGYFSMRRRLDREREVNLIKEEDVSKILAKDVTKFKKIQGKSDPEDPYGPDDEEHDDVSR
ncbi:hypothetical protein CRE_26688 [Caenorhabditis remanei]|uniref:Uncharacterized protein n=1 Tax=Caenorhabditis remanei TaxID=31234 RepID=E3ML00_CAERE|nr:hypothetical protein CRE_26688 [Caenorhabditis remanei]